MDRLSRGQRSLFAFFSVVLCCALISCGGPEPDPRGRAAAEWAIKRGGTVRVMGVAGVIGDMSQLPRGEVALEEINLNQLDPRERPVQDDELAVLEGLTNLRVLGLHGSQINDQGCEMIGGIKSLRQVELSQSRISDEGLAHLARLPNLESLFIRNVGDRVTDEGIKSFRRTSKANVFR